MDSKFVSVLIILSLISGCAFVRKPSKEELLLMDNPPVQIKEKINLLLPKAISWYAAEENKLLSKGRSLTDKEKTFARRVGVKRVNNIRIVIEQNFPMPTDEILLQKARKYGFGSSYEGGRTMGYAILLKPQYKSDSKVIFHELIHVSQIERLGREKFIKRYITEMEIVGYSRSPLELEAYEKQSLFEHKP